MAQTDTPIRAQRKVREGLVVSAKMQKTIVVRIGRVTSHRKYSRVIRQANKFKVHDETNSAGVGDVVRIMETRPLSKDKHWRLVDIVHKASSAPPVPGQEAPPRHSQKRAVSDTGSKPVSDTERVA